jgi:hypothetical protein
MVAIITEVRWNLNVVLFSISFIAKDGETFLHVFFTYLDFFLGKSFVQFICSFLHWVIDILGV